MITYKIEVEEDGVFIDYTSKTTLPISLTERLDLGFDTASVILESIDKNTAFKPYTRVKITVGLKVFRFYTTNPEAPKVIYGSNAKYTHNLSLIEPTKILETIFAETLTVTQNLSGSYNQGYLLSDMVVQYISDDNGFDITSPKWQFWYPIFSGEELVLPATEDDLINYSYPLGFNYNTTTISITNSWGSPITYGETVPPLTQGDHFIKFRLNLSCSTPSGGTFGIYDITFNFTARNEIPEKLPVTISNEMQRVIDVCDLRRDGIDNVKFVIDPLILSKYNNERCPEFSFSKQTLWEMLLQFGDYIHAIPRLTSDENENWNVITFDFLGKQDEAVNGGILSYSQTSNNIDTYATDLDSNVENITNTDNVEEGSIIEPGNNIFNTVRVEQGGTEVTVDTALFKTDFPIAKLVKVIVFWDGVEYDITKFCYETYEYSVLSDYYTAYPYSTAFALQYSLGQRNITKLQHKNQNILGAVFVNEAIINILKKLGATIISNNILDLQYRIEYVPIINARVKQKKTNYHDFETKATLVYNQSANAVNSSSYGENIKGAVLRYGNEETAENYYTNSITAVPEIGTKVGNKYIFSINYEFYADFIKYSLEYSENFNRLSGFVGVNSNVRMYEVSERQVYERNLNYSSSITVGTIQAEQQSSSTPLTLSAKLGIMQTFSADDSGIYAEEFDPTFARMLIKAVNDELITEVALPLNTFGFGNSLVFTCKFQDNYSAGEKVIRGQVANKLIQDYVSYVDAYGNVEKIGFSLCRDILSSDTETTADNLPNIVGLTYSKIIDAESNELVVKKDSRERLSFTYQIHFLTNDNDIILGFGLTNTNRLTRQEITDAVKVYAMPRKIGQFEKNIDLTGATLIKTFGSIASDFNIPDPATLPYFSIKPIETSVNCESLAFVNENGDLVLAYNKSLFAEESSEEIYFNLK